MSDAPVQDLIDQLKLMRVELGDVKKRQLTEERLKHLQAALEENAEQIAGVQEAAAFGGRAGALELTKIVSSNAQTNIETIATANRSLSEARTEATSTILARRRNVGLLMGLTGLIGLFLGALLSLIVLNYYLKWDFEDSVKAAGLDLTCRAQGGFIANQDNGKFCVFEMDK